MKMREAGSILCASGALALGGCATITGEEMQSIMVSTAEKSGAQVVDAECRLENPRGNWTVKTPGAVSVRRSPDDIQVECKKAGAVPGLAKLISRAHGGMWGNIIFGGGIGALVDHNKGTGYEYPNRAVVVMGESTMIDRKEETDKERQAAQETPAR